MKNKIEKDWKIVLQYNCDSFPFYIQFFKIIWTDEKEKTPNDKMKIVNSSKFNTRVLSLMRSNKPF